METERSAHYRATSERGLPMAEQLGGEVVARICGIDVSGLMALPVAVLAGLLILFGGGARPLTIWDRLLLALSAAAVIAGPWWLARAYWSVWLEESVLEVQRGRRRYRVPLEDIEDITEWPVAQPGSVTISLKPQTGRPTLIEFVPIGGLRLASPDPSVQRLRLAVAEAKARVSSSG